MKMMPDRASFTQMTDGSPEDYQIIGRSNGEFFAGLPDRVLRHLELLESDHGGFAVSRLEHSLQTATRALQDDRDEEYVVCALLHDIGDTLGCTNHADLAATILEPFVSEENHWIVKHHGIFQGYYFFHYLGLNRNMRDEHKGHPHWRACASFCAKYDQNSFDPAFKSESLEFFEPMVKSVFSEVQKSIYKRPAQADEGTGFLGSHATAP